VCNRKGNLQCGVCACNKGSIGRNCECFADSTNTKVGTDDVSACKSTNTTDEICSNRGDCKCGACSCHLRRNPNEVSI
jgi:protocadherin alpha